MNRTRSHILALDQGTPSSRAIVFDALGQAVAVAQREFPKTYPKPGWEPLHRLWENPPVTCLHAVPSSPDCLPGKAVHAKGIIAFHESKGIRKQIAKLKALYLNRQ